MSKITYQGRSIDLEHLKRIAVQGIRINVSADQLTPVNCDDHHELIVVAKAKDGYDVLCGQPLAGEQAARMVTKHVLKKAEIVTADPLAKASPADIQRLYERFHAHPAQARR